MTTTQAPSLVLLHLDGERRLVLDAEDVYYLEAAADDTIVRRRGRRTLRDVRPLGELMPQFQRAGFHRVHDKWAVNLGRIREIRRQRDGSDWELAMLPPVNRVIPISRRRWRGLLARFGE
jgi:DNA-binding LytR/AlgR family response regulator